MAEKRIDTPTGTETVGHEWDGIEELNTPLPRWWLWSFYASILFAIGYVILYPALPMLHSASQGTLGWTSHGQLDRDLAARNAELAPVYAAIARTPADQLPANPQFHRTDGDFPLVWAKMYGNGRVFYSALGHDAKTWDNPDVYRMYYEAIRWALKLTDADVTPRPLPVAAGAK